MFLFPQNSLSVASLILVLFFIQSAFFFLFFYIKVNRLLQYSSKEHLYFSAMSAAQALYSIGAWQLYSNKLEEACAYWQRLQWVAGILLFIFFVLFTIDYLHLKLGKLKWAFVFPTLLLAMAALFDRAFLKAPSYLKAFSIFGQSYQIYEMEMGPLGKIAGLWMGFFILVLLFIWFFYLTQKRTQLRAAALGILFLLMAACNELLVALGYYRSPYVLEYGFFFFSVSFYIQLFSDFFDLYRENVLSEKELEKLNEESRFFINTMAHDLKAPLLSIEGFAEMFEAESRNLSPPQKNYLSRIQRNASHMMKLVVDLQSLIQIGFLREDKEVFEFRKVLEEVLASFEIRLQKFEIKIQIPENLPPIIFTKRRLVDVLSNLFDNAAKYASKAKNPTLKISAECLSDKIWVFIQDNGPGIPFEHQEKIFETFYRANQEVEGSGVGLAAVQKILENAGEKIWLKNQVQEGACFVFTLSWKK